MSLSKWAAVCHSKCLFFHDWSQKLHDTTKPPFSINCFSIFNSNRNEMTWWKYSFTKRRWPRKPFLNQLKGAAQCVPRESWKANEPTECASEQQTQRLLVALNLLSVSHTHKHMVDVHSEFRHKDTSQKHTYTHVIWIEINQLAGNWHERNSNGGRKRKHTLKCSPCSQWPERTFQMRRVNTLTLSRKLMWAENPPCLTWWAMWQNVECEWGRLGWHLPILFRLRKKRKPNRGPSLRVRNEGRSRP